MSTGLDGLAEREEAEISTYISVPPCSNESHRPWWWEFLAQCVVPPKTKLLRIVSCSLCYRDVSHEMLDEPAWMHGKWFDEPIYRPLRMDLPLC